MPQTTVTKHAQQRPVIGCYAGFIIGDHRIQRLAVHDDSVKDLCGNGSRFSPGVCHGQA
jgi:hypothetical protein